MNLLDEFDLSESKPFSIIMEQYLKLHDSASAVIPDVASYRCLIGKLQYLTVTKPDISFTVNQLSQFLQAPLFDHLKAVIPVLRYLKGTIGQGLFSLLLILLF